MRRACACTLSPRSQVKSRIELRDTWRRRQAGAMGPAHMCTANHDIYQAGVGAMHCYKAPLWGRRLIIDSLNPTPRFAHRPLLLL